MLFPRLLGEFDGGAFESLTIRLIAADDETHLTIVFLQMMKFESQTQPICTCLFARLQTCMLACVLAALQQTKNTWAFLAAPYWGVWFPEGYLARNSPGVLHCRTTSRRVPGTVFGCRTSDPSFGILAENPAGECRHWSGFLGCLPNSLSNAQLLGEKQFWGGLRVLLERLQWMSWRLNVVLSGSDVVCPLSLIMNANWRLDFSWCAWKDHGGLGECLQGAMGVCTRKFSGTLACERQESGWLPTWSSYNQRGMMVGTMGDCSLADAVVQSQQGGSLTKWKLWRCPWQHINIKQWNDATAPTTQHSAPRISNCYIKDGFVTSSIFNFLKKMVKMLGEADFFIRTKTYENPISPFHPPRFSHLKKTLVFRCFKKPSSPFAWCGGFLEGFNASLAFEAIWKDASQAAGGRTGWREKRGLVLFFLAQKEPVFQKSLMLGMFSFFKTCHMFLCICHLFECFRIRLSILVYLMTSPNSQARHVFMNRSRVTE